MVSRTPLSRHRFASPSSARRKSRIRAVTSAVGRFQLSEENAYRVRVPTPSRTAASTMLRAVRSPASCPAERVSPCAVAQRPLPSMITARWRPSKEAGAVGDPECRVIGMLRESAFPRGADQRFHVVEIALECATAAGGEAILRARHATLERLGAGDVGGVLELA